ncbi:MAG TPA: ABC transporter permease [Pseudonocardiaceae bacterium]|jgi:ABC-2 type transport system permease protein|nr:ABC transporter permease [Pseudonocardiaceae bacterium]
MFYLLRLEIRRMLADKRFLILMLCLPIGMYLLFTNLFGNQPQSGPPAALELMISMAAMGSIGAAMMTTGPRIAQERGNGWLRQLKIMPIRPGTVIGAKLLSAMLSAIPAIALVDLTAVLDHGVRLSAGQWLGIGALLLLGTAPFAALGAVIGYLTDDASAFAVMYGLLIFLSAIGGLWMPVSALPSALRDIARVLPSNRLADLGWRIVEGQAPLAADGLVLAAWLAGFTGLAVLGYRRANVAR